MRLPKPGCGFDAFGGWSLAVWQSWFGHRAQKKTWLYVVGCDPKDIPPYPLSLNAITHVINIDSGTPKALRRPEVSKKEREATPVEFAKWLIKLAGLCNHSKHF